MQLGASAASPVRAAPGLAPFLAQRVNVGDRDVAGMNAPQILDNGVE